LAIYFVIWVDLQEALEQEGPLREEEGKRKKNHKLI
jgi:hypothetical protein